MNAGQFIMSMTQSVAKSVIPDAALPANGDLKLADGTFAGLLGALQTEAGQPSNTPQVKNEVAVSESEPVDVSVKDLVADSSQNRVEVSTTEAQMVLAAYAQTAGIPIVNTLASHGVGAVQNVSDTAAAEQPKSTASVLQVSSGIITKPDQVPFQPAAESLRSVQQMAVETLPQNQPVPQQHSGRMPVVNISTGHDVDAIQNVQNVFPKTALGQSVRPDIENSTFQSPSIIVNKTAIVEPATKASIVAEAAVQPRSVAPLQSVRMPQAEAVTTSVSDQQPIRQAADINEASGRTALQAVAENLVVPALQPEQQLQPAIPAAVKPSTKVAEALVPPQPEMPLQQNGRMANVNILPNHDVDTQQNVSVTPKAQAAEIVSAPALQAEQQPQPAIPAAVKPSTKVAEAPVPPQPVMPLQQNYRMANVNFLPNHDVDMQQNVSVTPKAQTAEIVSAPALQAEQQPQPAIPAAVKPSTKVAEAPVPPQPVMQQNGRMSNVNILPNHDVDTQQNVSVTPKAKAAEIVSAPALQAEQQPQPAIPAAVKPSTKVAEAPVPPQPVMPLQQNDRMANVNILPNHDVDTQQNVSVTPKAQAAEIVSAPAVQTEQQPQPAIPAAVKPSTKVAEAPVPPQPVMQQNGRMSNVNILPNYDVDMQQDVSVAPRAQAVEPVQLSHQLVVAQDLEEITFSLPRPIFASKVNQLGMNSSGLSETPVFSSQIISLDLEQPQNSPVEPEAASEMPEGTHSAQRPQIGKTATFLMPPRPDAGLEKLEQTEIVMTSATTEASVLQAETDNLVKGVAVTRPASLHQAAHGLSSQPVPDVRGEAARTSSALAVSKENVVSEQNSVSAGEAVLTSDDSSNSGDQTGTDLTSHNRNLTPLVSGQLKSEHQTAGSVQNFKVNAEQPRQDLPEQIVHQVRERLVQYEVKPGNQQITLTLSPENMGDVKMNLNLQGQKLSVEIVTDNRAARDAILQHSDSLRDSLARQNIAVESFDVTSNGRGAGNPGHNQDAWKELARQKQQQFWTSPSGYSLPQVDSASIPSYQVKNEHTMLDIHY